MGIFLFWEGGGYEECLFLFLYFFFWKYVDMVDFIYPFITLFTLIMIRDTCQYLTFQLKHGFISVYVK